MIQMPHSSPLLITLYSSPNLGRLVSTFEDGTGLRYISDAADSLSLDMVISAAANMTSLTSAKLTRNVLSACIISSLQRYPHLERLYIRNLSPFDVIWDLKPTSLTSLKWTIPKTYHYGNANNEIRNTIQYVTNVVKHTCPLLTSLDIIIENSSDMDPSYRFPDIPKQAIREVEPWVQLYKKTTDDNLTLGNLQHLGLQFKHYDIDSQTWDLMEQLVRQNNETLTSLTIPPDLCERILSSAIVLESLTDLNVDGTLRTPIIAEAITAQFGAKLEQFSVVAMDSPFNAYLGRSIGTWTNLKYLCIGDTEMADGPYCDDGRPDFEAYDLVNPHLPLVMLPF